MGWYSKSVSAATNDQAAVEEDEQDDGTNNITNNPMKTINTSLENLDDGGWDQPTPFPFVQGTDCCGQVVRVPGVGTTADEDQQHRNRMDYRQLLGKRVLIRPVMRTQTFAAWDSVWMASDFDGAFAQYVKVPVGEVFPVTVDGGSDNDANNKSKTTWSDAELASIPCAYGTAENMIHRANVGKDDRVLIPGASGGVGSAAVQLAKRRGAVVMALVGSSAKADALKALGADHVVVTGRYGDPGFAEALQALENSVDVVIDNVAGPGFQLILNTLKRGGRLATSGAISGPIVQLDYRTMYLKDLTLIGCTAWDEPVMPNLIRYVEQNEIRPLVDTIFPMQNIVQAQKLFLEKKHVGKFVLIPPPLDSNPVMSS